MLTPANFSNWMYYLDPSKRLLDTFIPGSHDSSAYISPTGMSLADEALGAVTQGGNYYEQLSTGIRYFDVRCVESGGQIYLHHGIINGEVFEDTLTSQILKFANENPTEIIFLDIDIKDHCELMVLAILQKNIPDTWFAREHLNSDGSFNTNVTWNDLRQNSRRFVVTWSSMAFTAQGNNQLFTDWSGLLSTPTMVELNNRLYMCLLDYDGAIYIAQSSDGINWDSKQTVQSQRLFGDWGGVGSTPTMVNFNGTLYMCLLDHDGAIYIAQSGDGINWDSKQTVQGQRLFGDWGGVGSTPTMVSYNGTLYMCLLDHDGAIYIAQSSNGIDWDSKQTVQGQRLFGDWGGVGSTPTMVNYNGTLYMCLLDNDGAIYIAQSGDGIDWDSKQTVQGQRLFGDWAGVLSTPNMINNKGALLMCLLDNDGGIYIAKGSGLVWDSKQTVQGQRQFGDWSGIITTPTLVNFIDGFVHGDKVMCRLSSPGFNDGCIYTTVSHSGTTWYSNQSDTTSWLSFSDEMRWDPYDDFDKHGIDAILEYLDSYVSRWSKNKMFVAQVIDTPLFSPFTTPQEIELAYSDKLNGWVTKQNSQSNINIVLRDLVNSYPDTILYLINLNFN